MVTGQNIRVVQVSCSFRRHEFGVLCQQGGGSERGQEARTSSMKETERPKE